jgi:hypothetical protein
VALAPGRAEGRTRLLSATPPGSTLTHAAPVKYSISSYKHHKNNENKTKRNKFSSKSAKNVFDTKKAKCFNSEPKKLFFCSNNFLKINVKQQKIHF